MNTKKLLQSLIFLSIFAMAMRVSVDTDTWWHLKTGEYILEHRAIPQTDPFSFTRYQQDWQGASVGWVMQILLFSVYQYFGYAGLNILTALFVTAAFWFIYKILPGHILLKSFLLILAAITSSVFWAARPYLISFLFSAIFIWVFEQLWWRNKNYLWLLPILMLVWANAHGGFVYGFIVWAIYCCSSLLMWVLNAERSLPIGARFNKEWFQKGLKGNFGKLLLIGVLLILAVCISASGPKLLLYPFETVSISALQNYIQEWQSPNFHNTNTQAFLGMLLLGFTLLGFSKQRITFSDWLVIIVFGSLALLSARNIAIFALLCLPVYSRHAAPLVDDFFARKQLALFTDKQPSMFFQTLNSLILILMLVAVWIKINPVLKEETNRQAIERMVPVQAVNHLQAHPFEGNLFNAYNWGGYLIWHLPESSVFVDGRTDLYGDEILSEWIQIWNASKNWGVLLDHWQIGVVLIEPDSPLSRELHYSDWDLVYEDSQAVIYQRSTLEGDKK